MFFVGDEFQSIYGFRHADVAVFRERRERAALRLPLSRNYRSRPEVLAAVNHLFSEEFGDGYQPLAASGEFSDPVFGHPVELLVTDKRSYREAGEGWRDGEARRDRAPRARARRQRCRVAGRDRPALRRGHRRRALRGCAACGRPADLPRHGPRVLRPATGRRSALVPAPAAQPLRRRGPRHRARLPVRRRLERRSGAHSQARRETSAVHRSRACAARAAVGERPAPGARVQAAVRPARGSLDAVVARASVRGDRLGARLRPGGARPVGRTPPLREPPQADAARALLRGPARSGYRRLRRLHPRPAGRRSLTARGRLRRRRRRRGASAHDPCGEGARVQGRDRRRCRPRHRRSPVFRRDPRALRTGRSGSV